jgi:hypothetical protein
VHFVQGVWNLRVDRTLVLGTYWIHQNIYDDVRHGKPPRAEEKLLLGVVWDVKK